MKRIIFSAPVNINHSCPALLRYTVTAASWLLSAQGVSERLPAAVRWFPLSAERLITGWQRVTAPEMVIQSVPGERYRAEVRTKGQAE